MCKKTMSKPNEKPWFIQCPNPKCLCNDMHKIEWKEQYPVYSKMYKEADGSVTINRDDGEVFWDGGGDGDGAKLACMKCATEWDMPKNVSTHINWE